MNMKKTIVLATLLFLAPRRTQAQQPSAPARGEAYLFIGQGVYTVDSAHYGIGHVGGGGDVRLFEGLGISSELGAMGRAGDGVGLFSLGPSFHFLRASNKSKLIPFVHAGYARPFGSNEFTYSHSLFYFGGGFNYWVFRRVGLRLDFQDYVDHGRVVTAHYPAIRIGLVVR